MEKLEVGECFHLQFELFCMFLCVFFVDVSKEKKWVGCVANPIFLRIFRFFNLTRPPRSLSAIDALLLAMSILCISQSHIDIPRYSSTSYTHKFDKQIHLLLHGLAAAGKCTGNCVHIIHIIVTCRHLDVLIYKLHPSI